MVFDASCHGRISLSPLRTRTSPRRTRVSVHLNGGSKGLALTIVDDGVGFDVDAAWGKGLGLISMAERLEAIHGTLEIRSNPGAGTRVDVTAPLSVMPITEATAV
jgi:signal transduction histidine kinase